MNFKIANQMSYCGLLTSCACFIDMIPIFQEKASNLCKKWEVLLKDSQSGYADAQVQNDLQTMVSERDIMFDYLPVIGNFNCYVRY